MSGSLFGRVLGSMGGGAVLFLLLGLLLLALSLVLGALAALAWGAPQAQASSQLVLVLDPQRPSHVIDGIYLEVRAWPEVARLQFALDADTLDLPGSVSEAPGTPAILLTLTPGAAPQPVIELAGLIDGVVRVVPLQIGPVNVPEQRQAVKPILLTVFVVFLLASFFSLVAGVRRLLRQWRGELELLRLTGIPRRKTVSSFANVAVLAGGLGAVLGALLIYFGLPWTQANVEAAAPYLGAVVDPERMLGLALGGLILGLLVGVAAGLWGCQRGQA